MQPDYDEWLRKPTWSFQEVLYLIARLDPELNPQNAGIWVDLDTGRIAPVKSDQAVIRRVARAAVEMQARGIFDLIDRAIKAGDLKPTEPGGEHFRSHEILAYLINRGVSLPAEMTPAFNNSALTNALKDWFASPLEGLPADVRARVNLHFVPMPWNGLTAEQRKSVAEKLDYQRDPNTREERERQIDLGERVRDIQREILELEEMAASTPLERKSKERKLAQLRAQLQEIAAEHDDHAGPNPTRDEKLQASASALAQRLKSDGRKSITKREIAWELAQSDEWKEMTANRIERVIKVTW